MIVGTDIETVVRLAVVPPHNLSASVLRVEPKPGVAAGGRSFGSGLFAPEHGHKPRTRHYGVGFEKFNRRIGIHLR